MKNFLTICTVSGLALGPVKAAELNIVTDIAPVGALVSQITGHEVTVLVEPGQSPHDASLKPSMARALQDADVVIWMGEAMAPGLLKPIGELASDASVLELLDIEGIDYLEFREEATFEVEDAHDEHNDEAEHDEHHHHEGVDPHAWLSHSIVASWAVEIAEHLSAVDPSAAEQYTALGTSLAANTMTAQAEFQVTIGTAGTESRPLVAMHDAFQYLETAFDLKVVAALTDGDGSAPSAARMAAVDAAVEENAPLCLISDQAETGGANLRMANALGLKLVPLDILGARQPQGPDLYAAMMKQIAVDLKDCL